MVKKLKAMAEKKAAGAAGLLDNALAQSIKESAQQIWLAGMGAFAKAQAEGTRSFDKLIQDGLSLQKKTQGLAEEKISEVTGKMTAMAGEVSARAGQHW
ncbi:MAG: phasin family protein, partial [Burkholderiaceae bacterium]